MIQAERPKLKHGLRNNVEFLGLYTSILAFAREEFESQQGKRGEKNTKLRIHVNLCHIHDLEFHSVGNRKTLKSFKQRSDSVI